MRSLLLTTALAAGAAVVAMASIATPAGAQNGYFPSGGGGVSNQNVLWGDYFYVDPASNFAQGETLVHIDRGAPFDCSNPLFDVFCQGHAPWTSKSPGAGPSQSGQPE